MQQQLAASMLYNKAMVTFAAATKTTSTSPPRAPAQRRVDHFVAITCSDPSDSCDLYSDDCRSHAQLVSPSRDPIGYVDGKHLYCAYFVPNGMDPSGKRKVVGTRKVCCMYNYPGRTSNAWVGEADCPTGQDAKSCCDSVDGTIYNWDVVAFVDQPCDSTPNCKKSSAGAIAGCSWLIAVPTDPTDAVGTPVGCIVGTVAGVTYLCCSAYVLSFPYQGGNPAKNALCSCKCATSSNSPPPFDRDIDTSKPFTFPRLACLAIGCSCQD